MKHIKSAMMITKSSIREEWDLCIDGIWYCADFEGCDASDRGMLEDMLKKEK